MKQHLNFLIFILSLISVTSDSPSTQSTPLTDTNVVVTPEELPPPPDSKLFYMLYDTKQDANMILDLSRLWDTDIQLEHFQFLHDQITDPKIDQETKQYAQSILTKADQRFKESFQMLGLRIDYDLMDIIREIKNIQDERPPICQKLRILLLEADQKATEFAEKRKQEKQDVADQQKNQPEHEKEHDSTKIHENGENISSSFFAQVTSTKICKNLKKLFNILSD